MGDDIAGPVHIDIANFSDVQLQRLKYVPELPPSLQTPSTTAVVAGEPTAARSSSDEANLRTWFASTYGQRIVNVVSSSSSGELGQNNNNNSNSEAPEKPLSATTQALRVGIVFAGRQAPGGHNVVSGLFDFLKGLNSQSTLLGFVGGTKGLFDQQTMEVTQEALSTYRNQGGYHMLGRSVDKIRSAKEQEQALSACSSLKLDGLVIVGGTYSNTDAAHLSEYFATKGCTTRVVGVPVTIDGDVHNQFVEATLGFDTATRVYSQLVGNMATDGNSAKKYWYYVKLMGRSVSRITLEVGLQTHPNMVVLGEDIEARKLTLIDIVREIADVVSDRAKSNKNYGIVLVPEGAISYIPELRTLIGEMNRLFADGVEAAAVPAKLTPWSQAVLAYLPALIRQQLFLERESSGAVQLSQISTEKLLAELVGEELNARKAHGVYKGKYATICSSFGYQARCSLPSNFDCCYGSSLGATAAALIAGGFHGLMATVRNLSGPVSSWEPAGVPMTAMMAVPAPGSTLSHSASSGALSAVVGAGAGSGHSGIRPAIQSAPVDIFGGAFQHLMRQAGAWRTGELYANPGPIQFSTSSATANSRTESLSLEQRQYMKRIAALRSKLDAIRDICRPGVSDALLDAAVSGISSLADILHVIKQRE